MMRPFRPIGYEQYYYPYHEDEESNISSTEENNPEESEEVGVKISQDNEPVKEEKADIVSRRFNKSPFKGEWVAILIVIVLFLIFFVYE